MILSMFLKLIVNYVIPIFIIIMLLIFIQMLYLYSIIRNYKKYEDKNYLEKNIKKFHSLQKIENYLMYVCNVIFCLTSIISFFVIGLKAGLFMFFINLIITAMLIFFKTKIIPDYFSDLD